MIIAPKEVFKEGGYTFDGFKDVWKRINSSWSPYEAAVVNEFKVVK